MAAQPQRYEHELLLMTEFHPNLTLSKSVSTEEFSFQIELRGNSSIASVWLCGCKTVRPVVVRIVMGTWRKHHVLLPNDDNDNVMLHDLSYLDKILITVHGMADPSPGSDVRLSLQKARLQGTLCDVQLLAGDATLPAHRLVLAARSPVLEKKLTEAAEGGVVVLATDCTRNAAEMFLEFLYTDRIDGWRDPPVSWDHTASPIPEVELMKLAAEYAVPELTTACAVRLMNCSALYALTVLRSAGLTDITGGALRRRLTAIVLDAKKNLTGGKEWKDFDAALPIIVDSMLAADIGSIPEVSKVSGNDTVISLYKAQQDDTLCDVKLVVDGSEIAAHRLVLAARSPVLYKMLTGTFKEATQGRVELTDVSRDAVERFVEFLYMDSVQDLKGVEVELLYLADKYVVPGLCNHVQQRVWEYGAKKALAVLHDAGLTEVLSRPLRRRLSMTVVDNMKSLSDTKEWAEFQTTYSALAMSILGYIDFRSKSFEMIF